MQQLVLQQALSLLVPLSPERTTARPRRQASIEFAVSSRESLECGIGTQKVEDAQQILDQCLSETRTISHLLHPRLLDESGLRSAGQWYVDGFSERSGIDVHLEVDERFGRMPQELETALFRVLQESLTNVHRHSGSPKVEISICLDAGSVVLGIRDYGCGFAPQTLRDVQNGCSMGVGLTGMRERITTLGGALEVDPAEPGVPIRVKLPIADSRRSAA